MRLISQIYLISLDVNIITILDNILGANIFFYVEVYNVVVFLTKVILLILNILI